MTVYADILFLVNFIMDSFILWIVSKCARKKIKRLRLAAGGFVMALMYTLTVFVTAFHFMNTLASSVIILSMGIAAAFRPAGPKIFFKLLALSYILSFAVGGLGLALFYLTDLPYAVNYLTAENMNAAKSVSWTLPAVCLAVSYAAIKTGVKIFGRVALKRQELCPVQIFLGGSDVTIEALVDTGHCLREPISRSPVIVAEFEFIKIFLPDKLKILFYENQENDLKRFLLSGADDTRETFVNRIRMIPFTSLGRQNGMLIGFRPDRVAVGPDKKEYDDVVIGIYNSRLTRDGRYRGLLSPELLTA